MNPNNYGSLEACQRLAAAGIVLETEASWREKIDQDDNGQWIQVGWEITSDQLFGKGNYPAPSMAEVWRELQKYVRSYVRIGSSEDKKTTFVEIAFGSCPIVTNVNPTDALIDLLIWVTEQKGKEKI